jgi:hypothetical protein
MPAVEETYGLMGHVVQQEILAAGLRQMVMRQRRSALLPHKDWLIVCEVI